MQNTFFHRIGCILLLVLLCAWPAAAQMDRATLTGTVTDSSGAVIPGAKVEITSPTTGLRRDMATGANGAYFVPGLPIGSYNVVISQAGFKTVEYKDVVLAVGQTRTLDVQLEIGQVTTSIEVTAAAETVNRVSAEISGVVESSQVRDIPLNGRRWVALMALVPGAISVGGGDDRSIRFSGRSRDDNNYTFDGVDASGVQESPQKQETRLAISLDSIAEFKVSSSTYTAESGVSGGGQINVVSKTGTNKFHGGVFEFLRNDVFDARSPFDPSKIPPFRLNQFGGNLGGPIVKDRTFFYSNFEGLQQRLSRTMIGYVPSAAFKAKVAAKSPALTPLMNDYPAGQTPVDANIDQLSLTGANKTREYSGMIRVDHKFTNKTTFYARYTIDDALLDNPGSVEGSRDTYEVRPSNLVLQLQHIFTPRIVNETKFGLNRSAYRHPTVGIAPLDLSSPDYDDLTPNALDLEIGTTFNYVDNLTITVGRHNYKMGAEIRRIQLNNTGNALDTATLSYASSDDLINNKANSLSVNSALGVGGMRRTFWMFYGQDEFKANPNLTLNLGVRYEYYSVMHEVLGRALVVDPVGCKGFCPPGTPYYAPDRNNFSPRVGLAWSPKPFKGKTVIRTGFGIYYSPGQNDDFSDPHESTAGRLNVSSADIPALSYPITPFLSQAQASGVSPKGIDRYRRDGYYENWTLALQQMFPHSFVASVAYVGSQGHKLFSNYAVNRLDPVTRTRPLTAFGQFNIKRNDANNNFNALQASLSRSFTSGWLWQTQYMFSHAITDGSIGAGETVAFQHVDCRQCDRSVTPYDVRHTITMNSVYQFPFGPGKKYGHVGGLAGKLIGGWELSGIGTASTGRPVNITVSRSASVMADGYTSNQRPDLVAGASIYAANKTIAGWFNKAAFAVPAKYTWGTLGRYAGRGPGLWEVDTALEKKTPLGEKVNMSFRAEAFNIFNHPVFGNPSANFSSGSFGRITGILNSGAIGTGAPRRLQFMLRLDF